MKNIFITLLIATTLSSCLNFAVRALAYPKWNPHYKVQGEQVFYFFPNAAGGSRTLVEGADPATFKQLSYEWGRDKKYVYYSQNRMEHIDVDSFELLKYGFARDKKSVYAGGGKKPGDPKSVVMLSKSCYMDKKAVYYTHVWLNKNYTYGSERKIAKSESHLRSMDAPESLIGKIRRERAKRGWTPLPR